MVEETRLSSDFVKQIVQVVKQVLRAEHGGQDHSPRHRGAPVEHAVILDAALATANNSKTSPSTATATVCRWDGSDYVESDDTLTVYNHSEYSDHSADTFGVARKINGHWWFFGDCGMMAERNPPEPP